MLVRVARDALIAYLIVSLSALASVASDAGYLILIPLGGAAFLAVGPPDRRAGGGLWRRRRRLGQPDPDAE